MTDLHFSRVPVLESRLEMRIGQTRNEVTQAVILYQTREVCILYLDTKSKYWEHLVEDYSLGNLDCPQFTAEHKGEPVGFYLPEFDGYVIEAMHLGKASIHLVLHYGAYTPKAYKRPEWFLALDDSRKKNFKTPLTISKNCV